MIGWMCIAFKAGSLKEAEILYSRAISLSTEEGSTVDATIKKALLSNRSMAFSKMGLFVSAKEDAEKMLALDKDYAKGYYRLGVALRGTHCYEEAISQFKRAMELEPTNKVVQAEVTKTEEAMRKHVARMEKEKQKGEEEEKEREKRQIAGSDRKIVSKKVIDVSREDSKQPVRTGAAKSSKKQKDDIDFSMRGYRTLKDGRKTTYFNMDRTEEELNLIGENKPQKLREAEEAQRAEAQKEGSAWNEGGTFEEKNLNSWGHTRLEEVVKGVVLECTKEVDGQAYRVVFSIKELEDVEGDASITFTRGKKRKIFDFNFRAKVVVKCFKKLSSSEQDVESSKELLKYEVKLDLFFPEFSGDVMTNEEDIECELHWESREKAGPFQDLILKSVRDNDAGFRTKIIDGLKLWTKEFNSMS